MKLPIKIPLNKGPATKDILESKAPVTKLLFLDFWTTRNLLGKAFYFPLMPFILLFGLLADAIEGDWFERLTRKKKFRDRNWFE